MYLKKRCLGIFILMLLLSRLTYAQLFQDYSSIAGINHHAVDSLRISAGVVIFDYDNDGLDDVYLNGGEKPHQLYKNLNDFDFERVTVASGLTEIAANIYGANAADLDNDGWEDLVLTTGEGMHTLLLKNNQDGTFSDITQDSGLETNNYWGTSITFADFNADGYVDFYIGNYAKNPVIPLDGDQRKGPYPNELYLSTGKPFKYEELAMQKGIAGKGFTLAVMATDLDQDFDIDLYVVNDFGIGINEGNKYYENDGNNNFTEKSEEKGLDLRIFGMGVSTGDYDKDGDFDLYVSDLTANHFLQQQRDGTFLNVVQETLAKGDYVSWGASFFDANNNSELDLFIPNGAVIGEQVQPSMYYENINGKFLETQFHQVTPPLFSRGMGLSDLDKDGDLDVIINNTTEKDTLNPQLIPIYRNTANLRAKENGFLFIDLEGELIHKDAYGSIVKLHLSNGQTLLRIKDNGGAYLSRHSSKVHFGIGTSTIDSLEVFWTNGSRNVYKDIPRNTWIIINELSGWELEKGNKVTSLEKETVKSIEVYPTKVSEELIVDLSKINQKINIHFFNIHGKLIKELTLEAGKKHQIDLSNFLFKSDLYLLKISYRSQVFTKKLFFNHY